MKTNLNKTIENIFVIGDVHGCYHTLQNLIKQFPKDASLIFVGDLCDKGDFSKEVIEFVKSNNYPCVKGNHEHLFQKNILYAVEKNVHTPWSSDIRYGGAQTIKSYKGDTSLIKEHLDWIKKLPLYLEIDTYFITHGFALEYYKHKDDENYYSNFLLNRIYSDTIEPKIKEDIINVFGHCIFDEVQVGEKFICLDTGCAKGNKLSALQLGTNKIFEEPMDKKDSSYSLKELTLEDIDLEMFNLNEIQNITLKNNCKYNQFDVISNEVLIYIVNKYPDNAKEEILAMKERAIIFPKQIKKVLN